MKILFVDLDGTLFEGIHVISELNTRRLVTFRKQGHIVVICTGRNKFETLPALLEHHIPYDYLILNNGGQVIDRDGNVLYNAVIPHDTGMDILRNVYQPDGQWIFCTDEDHCFSYLDGQLYYHGVEDVPIDGDFLTSASACHDFNILCIAPENQSVETVLEAKRKLEERYGHQIVCHQNLYYLDIVPPGCSKASAIDLIKNRYDNAVTYAIGDSYNDLPMILAADVGCTFDYADKEIQRLAVRIYHYVYELIDDLLKDKENAQ